MNTALVFAGGTGTRMHTKTKPKQFLEINGKPIIIHTIEHFENHELIDQIIVVCINDWIDYLIEKLKAFHIKKVIAVIPGGSTGQESIYNGLLFLYERSENPQKDIVLIHDGVRPLISEDLITDNINCVIKNGNAITISDVIETIIEVDDDENIIETIDRSKCRHAKAPQSFYLYDIFSAHCKAIEDGKTNVIDSATMMFLYGQTLFTVPGSRENIKITTPADFYILRAILEARENSQIWGI